MKAVRPASRWLLPLALAAALAAPGIARGQKLLGGPEPTPVPEVSPDSPRSALTEFFDLCNAGRYADASKFLDLAPGQEARAAELTRQLKAVLDRHLWVDLTKVSSLPGGHREDGLAPEFEELGSIPSPPGRPEPVRMVYRERPDAPNWVFTRATLQRVPHWYAELEDRWIRDHLPEALFRMGPQGLLWWQWLALLVFLPVLLLAGRLLGWLSERLLAKVAVRTPATWDDAVLVRLTGPFSLGWALLLGRAALPFLDVNAEGRSFVVGALAAGVIVAVFWALLRVVRISSEVAATSAWARTNPNAPSILTLGVRFGELFIFLLAFIAALSAFGVNVASILAGLGIGGIAIALAAQKTVENLFGSVSIGVDQPLRVGDTVKLGDVFGTVEAIGLRSTRIRTLDRTIVTIPNGKLADRDIESFAVRDRIRFFQPVGLLYGTTASQMRQVLSGIEATLRAHPKIWPDVVVARFKGFGPSSLEVEVMAWFQTADFEEFRTIREEVLLAIMEVVEGAGTSFAFPTQTVHLAPPAPPSAPEARA